MPDNKLLGNGAQLTYLSVSCPRCSTYAELAIKASHCVAASQPAGYFHYCAAECKSCQKILFVRGRTINGTMSGNVEQVYPFATLTDSMLGVPPEIVKDANEAYQCLSVGAWTAVVIMCRRAIQRSVKLMGASKDKLWEQIDELALSGVLSKDIKEWAHEIRHFGNFGAHPDDLFGDVTESDAHQTIDFLKSYLIYVYDMPTRVQQSRSRRAKTP